MKIPLLPAWILVAAAAGAGGCNEGTSVPTDGGNGGRATCLAIRNCVRDTCTNPDPSANEACVQTCISTGGSAAQQQYRTLTSCLVNVCCKEGAACGGGEPRCNQVGTPACESCTCQAQCAVSAPCRQAAIYCFGLEPDCSACK